MRTSLDLLGAPAGCHGFLTCRTRVQLASAAQTTVFAGRAATVFTPCRANFALRLRTTRVADDSTWLSTSNGLDRRLPILSAAHRLAIYLRAPHPILGELPAA